MAKLTILFADDQIPAESMSYVDVTDENAEIAIRNGLKEKHPDWSVQFINNCVALYHVVDSLCDAGFQVVTANTYRNANDLIQKSHYDVAIIDLGWSGDADVPIKERLYAGWNLFEKVISKNKDTKSPITIPILYSSRFGKNPSIGIRAAEKGILPVVKNYDRASCEALTAAVKFVETYVFGTSSKIKVEVPLQARYMGDVDAITILFLAADPSDASRLRLGEELREIQQKLQMASKRELFKLHQRMSVRPEDLSQALLDIKPQFIHFSGHGMAEGTLCFEDKLGHSHPIEPMALAALFGQFAGKIKCVVLNACFSDVQANAIVEHVDYVIGMKQAIGDRAAIAFSVGFYQALGAGLPIEDAYNLGCVQIMLQGIPEHLTPTLISKTHLQ